MDLANISDITQLKIMLADEFTRREEAAATFQQANANIVMIQDRIKALES